MMTALLLMLTVDLLENQKELKDVLTEPEYSAHYRSHCGN